MSDVVDRAFEVFKGMRSEFDSALMEQNTESDIRLKILDPLFCKVLGWDLSDIKTEENTGEGYLDYKFSIDGYAKLVVEAKRDTKAFDFSARTSGKAYKISGAVLSKRPDPHKGISQAIQYCGVKNCELACVTNGHEWIVFRANRAADGTDTREGMAFIFGGLENVEKNFTLFYDLLHKESVRKLAYRAFFQEAEGQPIRDKPFSKTIRAVDSFHAIPRSPLAGDVDRVMAEFFQKISGDADPDMLAKCFVTTKDSEIADQKLARITEDLASRITGIETQTAQDLSQVVKRVKESKRHEFVVIVGTKGAGKSTFVDRFFRHILDQKISDDCVLVRVDVGKSSGSIDSMVTWLNEKLIEIIESTLYGDGGPSYDELRGMFYDEYNRRKVGPHKILYESDPTKFRIEFGTHIDSIRETRPDRYIRGLIRSIVTSRKKIPCLVFDNTDHFSIDFQQAVFQFARSLYEEEVCLVILPITDKTSWQLSQQGALQSFHSESFYLPTPLARTVVEKRIDYLQELIEDSKRHKGTGYFTQRGISLSIGDLEGFVTSLQHVFLETGHVSSWIGNLSNNDIRRCLNLSREIVASPYMRVDGLIKAYVVGTTKRVSELDTKRAIIKKSFNIFPTGQNEFVQNIYALNTEIQSSPLLGLRVLKLLRDAKHHNASGLEDYIEVEQVIDYFYAIGLERRATLLCLSILLKTGLCFAHDPTVTDIANAKRVQLTPSGLQHLFWGGWDETYVHIMSQVTPISDEASFKNLRSFSEEDGYIRWRKETIHFLEYLLNQDSEYCFNQEHAAYSGQRKVITVLEKRRSKMQQDMVDMLSRRRSAR